MDITIIFAIFGGMVVGILVGHVIQSQKVDALQSEILTIKDDKIRLEDKLVLRNLQKQQPKVEPRISNPMEYIAIDFETALPARNSICAVGLTVVCNHKIAEQRHWLVKHAQYPDFNPRNISIHGITAIHTKDSPTLPEIWNELQSYLTDKTIIAYNANFDIDVLSKTLNTYNITFQPKDYVCIYELSKSTFALPDYRLPTVCKHLGIEIDHHNASSDATACARVAIYLLQQLGISHPTEIPTKQITKIEPVSTPQVPKERPPVQPNYFNEKNTVITGDLQSMTRNEAIDKLESLGAIIQKNVTKKTNLLIVGTQNNAIVGEDGMSGKQEKAAKLIEAGQPITILTETEFINQIQQNEPDFNNQIEPNEKKSRFNSGNSITIKISDLL